MSTPSEKRQLEIQLETISLLLRKINRLSVVAEQRRRELQVTYALIQGLLTQLTNTVVSLHLEHSLTQKDPRISPK